MITWVLVLYFGGIALIFFEVFMPGGILGVFGACAILGSAVLGVYAYPDQWYAVLGAQFVGIVLLALIFVWWFPRSSVSRSMILSANLDTNSGFTSDVSNHELVGHRLRVATALRPAGTIEYKGQRISAVADGDFIDAGNFVTVLEVHGNRVVVERAAPDDGGAGVA